MLFGKKKRLEAISTLQSDLKHIQDVRRLVCESKFTNPEVTRQIFLRLLELDEQLVQTAISTIKTI